MTNKRKTKAQRAAEQKAALYQRVHDVYCGAQGAVWSDDDFACAEQLTNIIPALRDLFAPQQIEMLYPWQPRCLRYFDNPKSAADFLYAQGYRA